MTSILTDLELLQIANELKRLKIKMGVHNQEMIPIKRDEFTNKINLLLQNNGYNSLEDYISILKIDSLKEYLLDNQLKISSINDLIYQKAEPDVNKYDLSINEISFLSLIHEFILYMVEYSNNKNKLIHICSSEDKKEKREKAFINDLVNNTPISKTTNPEKMAKMEFDYGIIHEELSEEATILFLRKFDNFLRSEKYKEFCKNNISKSIKYFLEIFKQFYIEK